MVQCTPKSPLFKGGGSAVSADGGFPPYCSPELKIRARQLRKDATKYEHRLWYDFLNKFKPRFLRQRPIGYYIVDFYCHKAALAVELDGSQHYEPEALEYDKERSEYLNSMGITVLRFHNSDIDNNFDKVCEKIATTVYERMLCVDGKSPTRCGGHPL
jgi:very-short-patch-repair endonuclease